MQVAILGLGRMGANMAIRLAQGGHRVVGWNRHKEPIKEIMKEGVIGAFEKKDMVKELTDKPRVVWFMLPAGKITDDAIMEVAPMLDKGDIIIDGANSRWSDDKNRQPPLQEMGLRYLDAGVSGGIWGLQEGYCLMVGGEKKIFKRLEPLFQALAPLEGYMYCGECGAGHFVKMVHNGIEYGMMAAYGEGFSILKASPYGANLNLAAVSHLWNRGSVVRSWLLELAEAAFLKNGDLESLQGYVEDSGEGRWTVQQAIDTGVPTPVIAAALFQRFRSRMLDSFSDKVLAALRNEFGGHAIVPATEEKKEASAGAGDVKPASRQK